MLPIATPIAQPRTVPSTTPLPILAVGPGRRVRAAVDSIAGSYPPNAVPMHAGAGYRAHVVRLPPVEYVPYHELAGRPNVILDGSPTEGTVVTISHWPGHPPPPEVADDLSAQMAFRMLDHPQLTGGVELVSNNHFDEDGLVSIYAATRPADALARRALLEDVAAAGDFGTYRDRLAARVSMVLSAYATGRADIDLPTDHAEETAVLFVELLDRLPHVCEHIEQYRQLWADEDATLDASERAIERGDATISELPDIDLAIVDVVGSTPRDGGHRFRDWTDGLHPMAVNNATERLVVATVRPGHYTVEQRYESWVQLRSRVLRRRRDLVPLAERLQDEEHGDAVWSAEPVSTMTPWMTSGEGESSITRSRFVELLGDHLRSAPPAWEPFAPRSQGSGSQGSGSQGSGS